MRHLIRESEKISAHGGFVGLQNLLGAPRHGRFQVMIRETVQNSWDARIDGGCPTYRLRLYEAGKTAVNALNQVILRDLPPSSIDRSVISKSLSGTLRILEIADFGTRGLGGPTRADVVPKRGESPDFVDFLRNVGSRRDRHLGGGTYGYGKSSLYTLSRCQTIVVSSVTADGERRLIACRVGSSFDVSRGGARGRYTGRHWWGVSDKGGDAIAPLRGAAARKLAAELGCSPRSGHDSGTSILIIDPDLPAKDDDPAAEDRSEAEYLRDFTRDTLLWFFWPKMLSARPKGRTMNFEVSMLGTAVELPDPARVWPLSLYGELLKRIDHDGKRSSKPDGKVMEIRSKLPDAHLGRLALKAHLGGGTAHKSAATVIPADLRHVALMRPAELVVTYLEGIRHPMDGLQWGGVFRCAPQDGIEAAFAAAEPPAHDDWVPAAVADKRQRRYVNVALRQIKEEMARFVQPNLPPPSTENTSLARAAEQLGPLLMDQEGYGPGSEERLATATEAR